MTYNASETYQDVTKPGTSDTMCQKDLEFATNVKKEVGEGISIEDKEPLLPPAAGPVTLCIRAPAPGHYALVVLHDRDLNGRFTFLRDGVGFPNNPRLRRSRPAASAAAMAVGPGVSATRIVLNYRRGFGLAPLR